MNPPVELPTSRQTKPTGFIEKSSRAPSSFKPPRLAYFDWRLFTSIGASLTTGIPAFCTGRPFTRTSPARIIAWAFCCDSARPRSTRARSRRVWGLAFIGEFAERNVGILTRRSQRARRVQRDASGAAWDEVFGDFAEARGAVAIGRQFADG